MKNQQPRVATIDKLDTNSYSFAFNHGIHEYKSTWVDYRDNIHNRECHCLYYHDSLPLFNPKCKHFHTKM